MCFESDSAARKKTRAKYEVMRMLRKMSHWLKLKPGQNVEMTIYFCRLERWNWEQIKIALFKELSPRRNKTILAMFASNFNNRRQKLIPSIFLKTKTGV